MSRQAPNHDMHGSDADPKQTHCSQCGERFTARACGPTHAAIQAARQAPRPRTRKGRRP